MRAAGGTLILACLPLAACSVATPPRLAMVQPAAAVPANIAFEPVPEGQARTELTTQFETAVKAGLEASGAQISPDAPYRLTVAIVQRPAAVGVTARKEGLPADGDWLSQPRKHHWLDACKAQRIEATLVMRDSGQGGKISRVSGAFDDCSADPDRVRELAEKLVAALLGR